VPHLEVNVGNRVASLDIDDLVVEDDVETVLIFDDVPANIFTSDVCSKLVTYISTGPYRLTVRTLGDLRSQNTRVDARKKSGRISTRSEPLVRLVVRSAQDRVGISLLQAALLASLVNLSRATSDVAGFNTPSLELGSTVSEGRSLD
jgi:hypothetical protein